MADATHRTELATQTVVETTGTPDFHERTVLWVIDKQLGAASRVRGPASVRTEVLDRHGVRRGFSAFGNAAS